MSAIELKITLNENGTLSMTGPIDNLHTCYGLLELAKDALRTRAAEKQQKVQPVALVGPLDFMKRPDGIGGR